MRAGSLFAFECLSLRFSFISYPCGLSFTASSCASYYLNVLLNFYIFPSFLFRAPCLLRAFVYSRACLRLSLCMCNLRSLWLVCLWLHEWLLLSLPGLFKYSPSMPPFIPSAYKPLFFHSMFYNPDGFLSFTKSLLCSFRSFGRILCNRVLQGIVGFFLLTLMWCVHVPIIRKWEKVSWWKTFQSHNLNLVQVINIPLFLHIIMKTYFSPSFPFPLDLVITFSTSCSAVSHLALGDANSTCLCHSCFFAPFAGNLHDKYLGITPRVCRASATMPPLATGKHRYLRIVADENERKEKQALNREKRPAGLNIMFDLWDLRGF